MPDKDWFPIIHLYPPEIWHDHQIIVCNVQGKELLRQLLDGRKSVEASTSDGEGYELILIETDDPCLYPDPYVDSIALEHDHSKWERLAEDANKIEEEAIEARRQTSG